ncbi:NAD(P)-binding protein [Coniophora puteana RWD-64-598 SS2]|uniref:NAD(P)-binding protein n=1 Tax=Coniophora puteana (strain RWD-64-598) TaxID=741705 RepID=A0A5M3MVJ3_CONPW|nr:NAD(P)-binding protein [Coniophora puteana RWD-64-598 SS2]EIW82725.1 NAD(P)-binding protein [Coniophora puteana RWD-64-598 SS2]
MSAYKIKGAQASSEDHYKRTLHRVEQIQSHLSKAPRTQRLKGKTCIITGVNSIHGIGRATALLFAHEGAQHLYLLDFSGENLPDLESTIRKQYPDVKVTTVQADAADDDAISGLCDLALKEEGRLDVFFANAGYASRNPLHETTDREWMETMRINTLSCFLAIKYGSKAMMETNVSRGKELSGGSIILTASVAGLQSGAGTIDYSASKAAVNSMAKTSTYQLQKTDIRVNSICPGLIETNMTKDMFDFARTRGSGSKIGQLNPMGRFGVAPEIAQMALFLASDDSSYVNGQNIAVDGGLASSLPVVPGRWA